MIVQTVLIRWMKETRGEPYATSRNRHPAAFSLPAAIPSRAYPVQEEQVLVHRLAFLQTTKGFQPLSDTCEWLAVSSAGIPPGAKRLPGLTPKRYAQGTEVHFGYDPSFGKPVRSDYQSRLLNERVFVLREGEYGRILINGRHTIEEGSLYEHRTFNVWNVEDTSELEQNSVHREPDYMRTYLASLW
ncbi:hypothetical protein [Saccharibacillus sacchari]|uniref:Uncharacterized protein n=1 Tax=Saccharibacillus sacchari TaxID=456493 RepID=A0ACC6P675_9BACL